MIILAIYHRILTHIQDSWIILDYTKDQIQDVEKPGVETDLPKARFEGVKSNFAYDICVSTQINGQTVAKSSIQAQNGIEMPEFAELQARRGKRGVTMTEF